MLDETRDRLSKAGEKVEGFCKDHFYSIGAGVITLFAGGMYLLNRKTNKTAEKAMWASVLLDAVKKDS